MTAIDWAALSRLVPEAVMVVVVLVYVRATQQQQIAHDEKRDAKDERRDTLYMQASAARDKQFLDAGAARDKQFTDALAQRDKEWREYMGVDRVRQAEGLAALTHEITLLGGLVTTGNALLQIHDRWEREELDRRLPFKSGTGD